MANTNTRTYRQRHTNRHCYPYNLPAKRQEKERVKCVEKLFDTLQLNIFNESIPHKLKGKAKFQD